MHESSLIALKSFALAYGGTEKVVVDLGGFDCWGINLRDFFKENKMKYISVDLESHYSVDIVVKPGEKLPFEDQSVDMVVSTSCFEHDPIFWMTFKEMCRIVKPDGFIYINAPSNGDYHCFPGDNWRFYLDAGQALAYWSGVKISMNLYFLLVLLKLFIYYQHELNGVIL